VDFCYHIKNIFLFQKTLTILRAVYQINSIQRYLSQQDKKAATLPRPYDRKKIEERRQEVKKKQEERKEREKEKEKERMVKSEIQEESKDMGKPPPRLSRSFIERMAAPRHPSTPDKKEPEKKEATPVKVSWRNWQLLAVFCKG